MVINRRRWPIWAPPVTGVWVTQFGALPKARAGRRVTTLNLTLITILVLRVALFPQPVRGGATSQDQQRQPLGSLSATGDVYVNESRVPGESTIFSNDALRTSETGSATFTTSGKGSLKITSQSQVAYPGNPQYAAELKSGTVVMSSVSGSTGISLRAGDSVVVAVTAGEQSTSKIEKTPDGSFLVTCLEGSIGVIPLQGANGLFIQTGQIVKISPQGELTAVEQPPAPAAPPQQASVQKKSNAGWIILAVAGGGGAVGAAAALGHGKGNSPPVSAAAP
jgi:hypothetical protein